MLLCVFRAIIPLGSRFQKDELFVGEHSSGVQGDGENVFKQYFACGIDVDNTVLSEAYCSKKDIGVIEGRV
jgi:hypothetical protein